MTRVYFKLLPGILMRPVVYFPLQFIWIYLLSDYSYVSNASSHDELPFLNIKNESAIYSSNNVTTDWNISYFAKDVHLFWQNNKSIFSQIRENSIVNRLVKIDPRQDVALGYDPVFLYRDKANVLQCNMESESTGPIVIGGFGDSGTRAIYKLIKLMTNYELCAARRYIIFLYTMYTYIYTHTHTYIYIYNMYIC